LVGFTQSGYQTSRSDAEKLLNRRFTGGGGVNKDLKSPGTRMERRSYTSERTTAALAKLLKLLPGDG